MGIYINMKNERKIKWNCINYCVVVVVAAAIIIFSYVINCELKKQNENILKDVANQNILNIENEIREKQKLLTGMSNEMQKVPDGQKEMILEAFKPYVEVYNFKRIGLANEDGIAVTTDGYKKNISSREFFTETMKGKMILTDITQDSFSGSEEVNIFGVPVYKQNGRDIYGVLFATYRTEIFRQYLDVESFEGHGYSMVIQQNGMIIADSEKSPVYGSDNFYEAVTEDVQENEKFVDEVKENISAGKSGISRYYSDTNQHYYYTPIDINGTKSTWYMLTVVPTYIFKQRTTPLIISVAVLITAVVFVLVIATIIYRQAYSTSQRELMRLAYIDPLTYGDNYALFLKNMRDSNIKKGCIVAVDLSEFRIINSVCGVAKGDEVLRNIWNIISDEIKEGEYAAHIHADRFILYWASENKVELLKRVKRLSNEISDISNNMEMPDIVPCFGLCISQNIADVEYIHNRANQAKQQSKGMRRNNYTFYDEIDISKQVEEKKLKDGFDKAIEKKQFEIWYQPKYGTLDGHIVGAEALVRWRDDSGELIPPHKFIPLFEKNGMILRLDEYIFENVCEQQKKWQQEGKKIVPVSVNISRASLYYSKIVERYTHIIKKYDISTSYIQLEITESAMIGNGEINHLVDEFHKAGFKLLLDDFGSGYSSLATLNELSFDIIKIDKSLVDYIGKPSGEKLLSAIVELLKNLGLMITAEGVENKEQVQFLQNLKCNDIQGFFFSKPLPSQEYENVME